MNIVALQTFLAIIETGSLVRASEKMNVTQSTVTARLKTLEEELGQVLLNRQKSGISLTPAGTKLLRYARIMTGLWRQAKYETSLPAGLEAVCNFGCDRELWHGAGRRFFNGVNADHPEIAISVQQGQSSQLQDWLSAGTVDVILTFEAIAKGSQTIYELPPEALILYSDRSDSPVTGDPEYTFVDHGAEYRQMHAEAFHAAVIARVNFDSSWWALTYILDNSGSAYLPEVLARPYLEDGRLFKVKDAPVFHRKNCLVVNDTVARNWSWFPGLIERLMGREHLA